MVREMGRIPAERNTNYDIIRTFEENYETEDALDKIDDSSQFGSYFELVKIKKFAYKNPRRE